LAVLEFELIFASPPVLSTLVTFEIGSYFLPRPAWTTELLFTLPDIAEMIGVCHYAQLLFEIRSQELFPGLALNHNPPNFSLPGS
jgi:hypothetical protein